MKLINSEKYREEPFIVKPLWKTQKSGAQK